MENTRNLIGRKFKGFKFENTGVVEYHHLMDKYLNKELEISHTTTDYVVTKNYDWYPLKEVLNHLIPEETQIPELPDGVLMLVSNDNKNWKEMRVVCKDKFNIIWCFNGGTFVTYNYCKPIPKLPNYTLQELKEKIGHDFNLID